MHTLFQLDHLVEFLIIYSTTHAPVNIASNNYTMGALGETQYAPVYGFVTDYQFAPPRSYPESVSKVKSA